MMNILERLPIILTKDKEFMKNAIKIQDGQIIYLPQDAVLVLLPEKDEEKTNE